MTRALCLTVAITSLLANAEPFKRLVGVGWYQGNFIVLPRTGGLMIVEVNSGRTRKLASQIPPEGAVQLSASRSSPDGKAKAVISMTLAQGKGDWSDTTFTPPAEYTTELQIDREGALRPSSSSSGISGAKVYWSPDSRFVLWEVKTTDADGESSEITYLVGSGGLPRAQLLASSDLLVKVTPLAINATSGAGVVVTLIANAQKPRAKSVVYAAKGFEAQAAKVAAALPGGATVEALTWKAGAEVVIAAGRSVLEVKP